MTIKFEIVNLLYLSRKEYYANEISSLTGLTERKIYRSLQKLINRGWIKRNRDPSKCFRGRTVRYRLTDSRTELNSIEYFLKNKK